MSIEDIVSDMTSKDVSKIRTASSEIIRNCQNKAVISKLIPFRDTIHHATLGLELGGAFALNNRFYKIALEIIDLHKNKKKCTCQIYETKTYECFNPEIESTNKSISLNVKTNYNNNLEYEIQCLRCKSKYYVSEREYHYTWWKWMKIKNDIILKSCGIEMVDKELHFIVNSIYTMLSKYSEKNTLFDSQKDRLLHFRRELLSHKSTEYFETSLQWFIVLDKLEKEIESKIVNKN
jgi:hypothetical protein